GGRAGRAAGRGAGELRHPRAVPRRRQRTARGLRGGDARRPHPVPDGDGPLLDVSGPPRGADRAGRERAGGRDHSGGPERGLGLRVARRPAAPDRERRPAPGAGAVGPDVAVRRRVRHQDRRVAVDAGEPSGAGRGPGRVGARLRPDRVLECGPRPPQGGAELGGAGDARQLAGAAGAVRAGGRVRPRLRRAGAADPAREGARDMTGDRATSDAVTSDAVGSDAGTSDAAAGRAARDAAPRVVLGGVSFDALTEAQVVEHVAAALGRGAGGHLVTPNIDIVRQARRDGEARAIIDAADLVVADGAPILWGGRLARRPLPARVTGASLIWTLSEAMARDGRSVYLLGGGAPGVPERAGEVLAGRYPGLRVAGAAAPPMGFDRDERQVAAVAAELTARKPDLVFVGLGFPRQDRLITALRPALPGAWFVGCGAAIPFAAGEAKRAPEWMQRSGLEWLHRLASEPRRLFSRYIVHDLPFAARFLTGCALDRYRR